MNEKDLIKYFYRNVESVQRFLLKLSRESLKHSLNKNIFISAEKLQKEKSEEMKTAGSDIAFLLMPNSKEL